MKRRTALQAALVLALVGCGESDDRQSSNQFGPDDTYDDTWAGIKMVLAYDAVAGRFAGSVENKLTYGTLEQMRVEILLSNDVKLGPTSPRDLAPGEVIYVVLPVPPADRDFELWEPHPTADNI